LARKFCFPAALRVQVWAEIDSIPIIVGERCSPRR
jgi:hypothetical protein